MLKVGLVGNGRVGKLITHEIAQSQDLLLSAVFARHAQDPLSSPVVTQWEEFLKHSEVVIDFSHPSGTEALLEALLMCPRPCVIGTTGLNSLQNTLLAQAAEEMPIVYASNTSQGMALLNQLCALSAKILAQSDIEIVEIHHRYKKDAPSGSAMSLAKTCAQARGVDLEHVRVSSRDGEVGPRKEGEIGVMSLRGGDVVGRHTVGFYCDGEYLELTHHATNRSTFALGALKAARWVVQQSRGLYSMADVLDF